MGLSKKKTDSEPNSGSKRTKIGNFMKSIFSRDPQPQTTKAWKKGAKKAKSQESPVVIKAEDLDIIAEESAKNRLSHFTRAPPPSNRRLPATRRPRSRVQNNSNATKTNSSSEIKNQQIPKPEMSNSGQERLNVKTKPERPPQPPVTRKPERPPQPQRPQKDQEQLPLPTPPPTPQKEDFAPVFRKRNLKTKDRITSVSTPDLKSDSEDLDEKRRRSTEGEKKDKKMKPSRSIWNLFFKSNPKEEKDEESEAEKENQRVEMRNNFNSKDEEMPPPERPKTPAAYSRSASVQEWKTSQLPPERPPLPADILRELKTKSDSYQIPYGKQNGQHLKSSGNNKCSTNEKRFSGRRSLPAPPSSHFVSG